MGPLGGLSVRGWSSWSRTFYPDWVLALLQPCFAPVSESKGPFGKDLTAQSKREVT